MNKKLKYVDEIEDRYKRKHYYFRRFGKRTPLPGLMYSHEFMAAYADALAASEPSQTLVQRETAGVRTFRALAELYYTSPKYLNLAASSRYNYKRIIDGFVREHGHGKVKQFKQEHWGKIAAKFQDRPGASNVLMKRIRTLTRWAVKLQWIDADPLARMETFNSREIHTWTEGEIVQYEAHWPLGTAQRLGFDILLSTGQRVSDVRSMVRPDSRDKIRITQQKTGTPLVITTHESLRASLVARDAVADRHSLMLPTAFGKMFSAKGLSNFMSKAIHKAGLPDICKAHGLRKAAARRLAEVGCSANEIMSVTGHKTLAEVERYTRAAEQETMNENAMKKFGTHAANQRES